MPKFLLFPAVLLDCEMLIEQLIILPHVDLLLQTLQRLPLFLLL
jgi:hypothetical protein